MTKKMDRNSGVYFFGLGLKKMFGNSNVCV